MTVVLLYSTWPRHTIPRCVLGRLDSGLATPWKKRLIGRIPLKIIVIILQNFLSIYSVVHSGPWVGPEAGKVNSRKGYTDDVRFSLLITGGICSTWCGGQQELNSDGISLTL